MDTDINSPKSIDPDQTKTLTEEKELSRKVVDKVQKLNEKAEDLAVTTKENLSAKHELLNKAKKLNEKAEELVVSAKEKEVVDDNLAKKAEELSTDLEQANKLMVGRELKMIQQKKEIAELKNSQ